jgi:hypothetical protein
LGVSPHPNKQTTTTTFRCKGNFHFKILFKKKGIGRTTRIFVCFSPVGHQKNKKTNKKKKKKKKKKRPSKKEIWLRVAELHTQLTVEKLFSQLAKRERI